MKSPDPIDAPTASVGGHGARRSAAWIGLAAALIIAAVLVAVLDWREARRLLGHTRWGYVAPALAVTAVSYAALSTSLLAVGRIVGLRAPAGITLRASFVSIAVNHVASLSGVAGYSLRTVLLRRFGEPPGVVLAMSLVHSYLNTVVMVALLPAGLAYLAIDHPLSRGGTATAAATAAASGVVVMLMTAALLSGRVRGALARGGASAVRSVLRGPRGESVAHALTDIDLAIAGGAAALRGRPALALLPATLIALDWAATFAACWFCFAALGERVPAGVLLTGFAIGMNAGVLSLVPGGLGVQEGSMAATFALLGVPLERAVLAAILFRVVYYLAPFVASLPLSWPLLRARHAAACAGSPPPAPDTR